MINAKELRIGNLVKDHLGRIQTVAEVRHDAYICYLRNGAKLKYKLNTTQPIPLTEEWLEKFGFEENTLIFFRNVNKDFTFKIVANGSKFNFVPHFAQKWDVELKSVHQLQNLYFCLCGEELEIKNTL